MRQFRTFTFRKSTDSRQLNTVALPDFAITHYKVPVAGHFDAQPSATLKSNMWQRSEGTFSTSGHTKFTRLCKQEREQTSVREGRCDSAIRPSEKLKEAYVLSWPREADV